MYSWSILSDAQAASTIFRREGFERTCVEGDSRTLACMLPGVGRRRGSRRLCIARRLCVAERRRRRLVLTSVSAYPACACGPRWLAGIALPPQGGKRRHDRARKTRKMPGFSSGWRGASAQVHGCLHYKIATCLINHPPRQSSSARDPASQVDHGSYATGSEGLQ